MQAGFLLRAPHKASQSLLYCGFPEGTPPIHRRGHASLSMKVCLSLCLFGGHFSKAMAEVQIIVLLVGIQRLLAILLPAHRPIQSSSLVLMTGVDQGLPIPSSSTGLERSGSLAWAHVRMVTVVRTGRCSARMFTVAQPWCGGSCQLCHCSAQGPQCSPDECPPHCVEGHSSAVGFRHQTHPLPIG